MNLNLRFFAFKLQLNEHAFRSVFIHRYAFISSVFFFFVPLDWTLNYAKINFNRHNNIDITHLAHEALTCIILMMMRWYDRKMKINRFNSQFKNSDYKRIRRRTNTYIKNGPTERTQNIKALWTNTNIQSIRLHGVRKHARDIFLLFYVIKWM